MFGRAFALLFAIATGLLRAFGQSLGGVAGM